MPKRPDLPCAGSCGRMMTRTAGSQQPGVAMCRPCRKERRERLASLPVHTCEKPPRQYSPYTPEERIEVKRARERRKGYVRRARMVGSLTAQEESMLRRKTRKCGLCAVVMTDEPYLPTSKELDHVVPLAIGGTHVIENVRFICRSCNVARPHDGSDVPAGLPPICRDEAMARARRDEREQKRKAVRVKPCCASCGGSRHVLINEVCRACHRQIKGRKAAELRLSGWKWKDIAAHLGLANPSSAYHSAYSHMPNTTKRDVAESVCMTE